MKWNRTASLCLLLALGSCAGDGGSSGTGITTAQGNIASVQTAKHSAPNRSGVATFLAVVKAALPFSVVANARSGVDSIRISIEGTPFTAESDANGLFLVRGNFAGPANLLFQRPEDGLIARLRINVPAGGILTLNNVRIDARRTDTDSRTLDFRGLVAGTNCPAGTIALVSQRRPRDGNIYSVRVPGSQLRDQTGTEVRCEDLRGGAGVTCHGNVSDDDETSIEEADVEVDGDDSGSGGDGGDNSGPGGGDDGGSSSGSTSSDSSSGPGGGD